MCFNLVLLQSLESHLSCSTCFLKLYLPLPAEVSFEKPDFSELAGEGQWSSVGVLERSFSSSSERASSAGGPFDDVSPLELWILSVSEEFECTSRKGLFLLTHNFLQSDNFTSTCEESFESWKQLFVLWLTSIRSVVSLTSFFDVRSFLCGSESTHLCGQTLESTVFFPSFTSAAGLGESDEDAFLVFSLSSKSLDECAIVAGADLTRDRVHLTTLSLLALAIVVSCRSLDAFPLFFVSLVTILLQGCFLLRVFCSPFSSPVFGDPDLLGREILPFEGDERQDILRLSIWVSSGIVSGEVSKLGFLSQSPPRFPLAAELRRDPREPSITMSCPKLFEPLAWHDLTAFSFSFSVGISKWADALPPSSWHDSWWLSFVADLRHDLFRLSILISDSCCTFVSSDVILPFCTSFSITGASRIMMEFFSLTTDASRVLLGLSISTFCSMSWIISTWDSSSCSFSSQQSDNFSLLADRMFFDLGLSPWVFCLLSPCEREARVMR